MDRNRSTNVADHGTHACSGLCRAERVVDVSFVHGDATDVLINTQVIVEVLSESTELLDRGEKFAGYRSLPSLADYLLVLTPEPE